MNTGQRTLLYLFCLIVLAIFLLVSATPAPASAFIIVFLIILPVIVSAAIAGLAYLTGRKKTASLPRTGKSIPIVNRVLLRAEARFPFDLFPDAIIISENEVTVIRKVFFFSGWTETVPVADIKRITYFKGPFFATLAIEQKNGEKIGIGYLNSEDAFFAREIIEGLILKHEGKVHIPPAAPPAVEAEILREAGKEPDEEKEKLEKAL